jgi:WD40 repeat protein
MYVYTHVVLFLKKRSKDHPKAASLLSAGADGYIRFWNCSTGKLFYENDCRQGKKEGNVAVATNLNNDMLIVADSFGWVYLYDIKNAGLQNNVDPDGNYIPKMPLLSSFYSRNTPITAVEYLESIKTIITASVDCTIRMFTVAIA